MDRKPVWKQGWLHNHSPAVKAHLKEHWLYYFLQVGSLLGAWSFWKHQQPPGYAIGVTAVLAAALTFHLEKRPSKWQKAIWLLLIAGFLWLEFDAIRQDRNDFAMQDAARRFAENRKFQSIADDLRKSMAANQENFEATLNRGEQAINTMTGGNSFCFMQFSLETTATTGVPEFFSRGEFPLTDVVARIINLDDLNRKRAVGGGARQQI